MGKILINYFSQSGHTKAMAQYVLQGVESQGKHEIRIIKADELKKEDVLWAQGIALGSPVYLGLVAWQLKKAWDQISQIIWGKMDGKIGCAFSSAGGWGGGAELACQSLLTMMMNLGMLTFGVTDYVDKGYTLHYGAVTEGAPRTQQAIDSCYRLGRRLSQWVSLYFDKDETAYPGPLSER